MVARADKCKRANAGFSLTEALVTLAILVMVSTIMATAVPAAYKAYQRLVDASNAHLLLSTTSTRLRDELSVADPATIVTDAATLADTSALVRYESLETGFETTLKFGVPDGATDDQEVLYLEERVKGADDPLSPPRLLIPKKGGAGAGSELVACLSGITYADGVFTVEGLQITRVGEDDDVAGAQVSDEDGTATELKIRVLAGTAS